jgi:hypothetical protein
MIATRAGIELLRRVHTLPLRIVEDCASADGSQALGGEITFTAANGDRLFGTYAAHIVTAGDLCP